MVLLGKLKNKIILALIFLVVFIIVFIQSCGSDSQKKNNKENPTTTNIENLPTINVPEFNSDSSYYFIEKQVSFGPRVPNSIAHQNCLVYLEDKLKYYGANVVIQESEVERYDGETLKMKNIIGSFNESKKNRILLCAHWDSRYIADADSVRISEPIDGANDGASGVGVLLEIARQVGAQSPNVGIDIIFFDVEDQGEGGGQGNPTSWCLGSQYWSSNPHISDYQAKYGILLDMVGGPNALFIQEGYSIYYAPELVKEVWDYAIQEGFLDYFSFDQINDYAVLDDHTVINEITLSNNRHIPTIDIIEYDNSNDHRFNKFWHTHGDNMDNIDKQTLHAVGQTVLSFIYNE